MNAVDHHIVDRVCGNTTSCCNDVGTSYQFNMKWHDQLWMFPPPGSGITQWGPGGMKAWYFGLRRMRLAESFRADKFAWLHDEYADTTVYRLPGQRVSRNGYGEMDKSNLLFLDGHASYLPVVPGNVPESFKNSNYSFVFEDLRF